METSRMRPNVRSGSTLATWQTADGVCFQEKTESSRLTRTDDPARSCYRHSATHPGERTSRGVCRLDRGECATPDERRLTIAPHRLSSCASSEIVSTPSIKVIAPYPRCALS